MQRYVPAHRLGISQILCYGLLFYIIAPLKAPISEASQLPETMILTYLSITMLIQALFMPYFGHACDKFGGLFVMAIGFLSGAMGMILLAHTNEVVTLTLAFVPIANSLWVSLCFLLITLGLGMACYDSAFNAVVQLDEVNARRHILLITIYGAVASTVAWLCLIPLLSKIGFYKTTIVVAMILIVTSLSLWQMARARASLTRKTAKDLAPFSMRHLTKDEKRSLFCISASGGLEYILFSATTLLWLSWFESRFDDLATAVLLASLYGVFQLVGRLLEMSVGRAFDARTTSLIAFALVPTSLLMMNVPILWCAVIAIMLNGIGHGVLTVNFGFVTNLYFRAEVYGRAKGWTALSRMLGTAIGPMLGGWLFALHQESFMTIMMILAILPAIPFVFLLKIRPINDIHQ